jgi:hypothetical protein
MKPCLVEAVILILTEQQARKMNQISPSNTTARRSISEMSKDILDQAVEETITCPYFGLQLDGSADAASCAQLLVYARYLKGDSVKGISVLRIPDHHCFSDMCCRCSILSPTRSWSGRS